MSVENPDAVLAVIRRERRRRRTFAIISHPDAGKTTLTEKLLLFGGAIHLAGSVKARRARKHATSDWMKVEQERGISITTSVLQFDYKGFAVNLLDTPGHQDFSEDTYRTLTAVDAAVMLIDAAKGVETQTKKLFKVCADRGIPIFTFVNKLDRGGREPLELMDEIEKILGIHAVPMTWPVGSGQGFRGIYSREDKLLHVFNREGHGERANEARRLDLETALVEGVLSEPELDHLLGETALLDEAQADFDLPAILAGKLTPMFFGSAMLNFGVEHFLGRFLELAPPPAARLTTTGPIDPEGRNFAGFIFKIQANMDPKHRDRIAFLRVCSGEFQKDLEVHHVRLDKTIRLANPQQFMARERIGVEAAYPGDIVGLFDPGHFRIGDTVTQEGTFEFEGIPRFPPEHFALVRLDDVSKRKQLKKGLEQLSQEGAIQLFRQKGMLDKDPVVGAVGQLQFEVLEARLDMEYSVKVTLTRLPYDRVRWVTGDEAEIAKLERGDLAILAEDRDGRTVVLIRDEWCEAHLASKHEKVKFASVEPR